jgi:hypothetical protein
MEIGDKYRYQNNRIAEVVDYDPTELEVCLRWGDKSEGWVSYAHLAESFTRVEDKPITPRQGYQPAPTKPELPNYWKLDCGDAATFDKVAAVVAPHFLKETSHSRQDETRRFLWHGTPTNMSSWGNDDCYDTFVQGANTEVSLKTVCEYYGIELDPLLSPPATPEPAPITAAVVAASKEIVTIVNEAACSCSLAELMDGHWSADCAHHATAPESYIGRTGLGIPRPCPTSGDTSLFTRAEINEATGTAADTTVPHWTETVRRW